MSEHILRTAKRVATDHAALMRVAAHNPYDNTHLRQVLELVLIKFVMALGLPDDEPQDAP